MQIRENPGTPARLRYLKGFDHSELRTLREAYQGHSLSTLDNRVSAHSKLYRYFIFHYFVANYGSCLLNVIFPTKASDQGIQTTVNEIDPKIIVPPSIGYGIGGTMAGIDTVYNLSFFSIRKEAVKSTLYVALLPPWRQIRDDLFRFASEHPGQAFLKTLEFLAQHAILLPVSLNGSITEMIYLPLDFSKPATRVGIVFALFFGNEFYRKYSYPNFYLGWKFWKNWNNRISLAGDLRKGRYSTALQVWLQGGSAVMLHSYPYFTYIAIVAKATLGWWFSPYFIAAVTFLYGLCVTYPATFDHYLKDREYVLKRLREDPETRRRALEILRVLGQPESEASIWEMQQQLVWLMHDSHRHHLRQQDGFFYLFRKEYMTAVQVTFRSLLGGYFGFGLGRHLASIINYKLSLGLAIPLGALSFGKLLYNAERERIVWRELRKIIPPSQPPPLDHIAEEKQAVAIRVEDLPAMEAPAERPKIVVAAAVTLNASGGLVGAMSTVGTLGELIGNSEPEVTTLVTLLSIEQMLNTMYFSYDKIADTVNDIYYSLPSCKEIYARFFSCCCGCCSRCRRRQPQGPADISEEKQPERRWFFQRS